MKKVVFLIAVVSISLMSFSKSSTGVKNTSTECQVDQDQPSFGGDKEGCGGGDRVCCANTSQNFG